MTQPFKIPPPPPMPDIREALEDVRELEKAVERAKRCWNRTQLVDALRSARHFLDLADRALEAGGEMKTT